MILIWFKQSDIFEIHSSASVPVKIKKKTMKMQTYMKPHMNSYNYEIHFK